MSTSPDAAPASAAKVEPESVALRASPRPVTRLNRRVPDFVIKPVTLRPDVEN